MTIAASGLEIMDQRQEAPGSLATLDNLFTKIPRRDTCRVDLNDFLDRVPSNSYWFLIAGQQQVPRYWLAKPRSDKANL
ncbi:MAG: hypothetical protein WAT23_04215 [Chromatiaceae bacterium]